MKQALQQGFTSRSRWLLQILGLTTLNLVDTTFTSALLNQFYL